MDQMKHERRYRGADLAAVAEGRLPPKSRRERGRQINQQQRQKLEILRLEHMKNCNNGKFEHVILRNKVDLERLPERQRHLVRSRGQQRQQQVKQHSRQAAQGDAPEKTQVEKT